MILRSAHTYKKLEQLGGEPSKLDIPKQTVAVLYSVQAIIDSGGFLYLFENDFPLNPPYSQFVDAYRRLGSNEAAVRLEKAVAMFPFKDPHHLPNRLQPRGPGIAAKSAHCQSRDHHHRDQHKCPHRSSRSVQFATRPRLRSRSTARKRRHCKESEETHMETG